MKEKAGLQIVDAREETPLAERRQVSHNDQGRRLYSAGACTLKSWEGIRETITAHWNGRVPRPAISVSMDPAEPQTADPTMKNAREATRV
jgi:hypothetical protein